MLKKVFSNALIYAIGPQIPKVATLLVLPILTKYLTSTDYGVYGVVLAYMGALSAFNDLGFVIVMANSFYKYPKRWPIVWRQMHGYLSVWAIFFWPFAGHFTFVHYSHLFTLREQSNIVNILLKKQIIDYFLDTVVNTIVE